MCVASTVPERGGGGERNVARARPHSMKRGTLDPFLFLSPLHPSVKNRSTPRMKIV